jgi:hypothetical protein
MRPGIRSLTALAALVTLVPSLAAFGQRTTDRQAIGSRPVAAPQGLDGGDLRRGGVRLTQSAVAPAQWVTLREVRRPRSRQYALVGGVMGFIASVVVARSMICPGTDCIDSAEASYPIVGVLFYGAAGAGVGALLGGGVGAMLDARTHASVPPHVGRPSR